MTQKYYYKTISKNMTTTYGYQTFKWKLGKNRLKNVTKGDACGHGLHVYTSLKKLTIGPFYPRIFKCTIGKIYGKDSDKVRTNEVTLLNEVHLKEVEDQYWAFHYCYYVKDIMTLSRIITKSSLAYEYCKLIKDRLMVRKHITNSFDAYGYCKYIKNIPEVRKYINEEHLLSLL